MGSLSFAKLHVAGNSFVVVDGRGRTLRWGDLARAMARPHDGVGADGLLVLDDPDAESRGSAIVLRTFNADGGEAELSGNGLLLAAKFASDRGWAAAASDTVEFTTAGGRRSVLAEREGGQLRRGEVALGSARDVRERSLETPLGTVAGTCCSLGNPHCVLLTHEPVDALDLAVLGPAIERHPAFPDRTNVSVVNVVTPHQLTVRLFERGVGETRSSGTCGTAAAFAAMHHGHARSPVAVHSPGGVATVRQDGSGALYYQAAPVEVFGGTWPLDSTTPRVPPLPPGPVPAGAHPPRPTGVTLG